MKVGITQRDVPGKHGEGIDCLEQDYVTYWERFGVRLIVIPNATKNVAAYLGMVDAVLITGGGEVDPTSYGEKIEEGMMVQPNRDKVEKEMVRLAVEKKLPVLGVCRGMQFLNVCFGGKLINIKKTLGDVHPIGNHSITVIDEKAKMLLGERFMVNSYHNYAVIENTLSSQLKAFATANDGIVEGWYHPTLPIAGIVWHPERKSPDDIVNGKIVRAFLERTLFWRNYHV